MPVAYFFAPVQTSIWAVWADQQKELKECIPLHKRGLELTVLIYITKISQLAKRTLQLNYTSRQFQQKNMTFPRGATLQHRGNSR